MGIIKSKKNIAGTIYEVLAILLFLAVCSYAYNMNDYKIIYKWGIVPLIPFIISIFYRSNQIGNNIKNAGLAIAAMFAYLDTIGINGLPAIAILLLVMLFFANLFSTEKVWSEMMKIVGGIASGSLAQAKISNNKTNKSKT